MGHSRSSQKPESKGAQEVLAGGPTSQSTGNGSVWGERQKEMGLKIESESESGGGLLGDFQVPNLGDG